MQELGFLEYASVASFCVLVILQCVAPKRVAAPQGFRRVVHNLLLFSINTLLMRLLVPLTLLSVATWAAQSQWGLFNLLQAPAWFSVLACVVVLDFAIYWQHVATHRFPLLWRMHKVHHADQDMDVTTAVRFHPLELIISLLYKSLAIVILGAPVMAVLIFELLLFVGSAFNHSNIALPAWLDRGLRLVIATPDTHRSHHSILPSERNTNYGFFLIWWDKLFGTYTQEPRDGHLKMAIGLESPEEVCEGVDKMLLAPFR